MARDFGDRPIDRQAARGMSYGPAEPTYKTEQPLLGPDDFVLTYERQKELHKELADARKATNDKNRVRRARRKARKLALQKGPPTI